MKIALRNFQEEAVDRLLYSLRGATTESQRAPQAVSLSAPTGAGKTVMVTALIESIIRGDDTTPPDHDATFLWLTDQPELNEQTRRKMLSHSSVLDSSRLVVVDNGFDEETFRPGSVFFLNTQKLAKTSRLVQPGDERTFTLWETIRQTAEAYNGHFVVVIDEAHRGMTDNGRHREEAETIAQKFVKGSPGEIPPVPVVLGVSATPERFFRRVADAGRSLGQVKIDEEAVRDSGLLKERIVLHHPTEDQPGDITMLRAAARRLADYESRWQSYCDEQSEPDVQPLLVVQVEDARSDRDEVSRSDISAAITAIEDEIGPMSPRAYAHSFQEGQPVLFGETRVRYVAPSDIHEDSQARIVFFKTSLNTGWDCPRAEVMMSFRAAYDATAIAQLVGRMVRTPLVRRIDVDEFLNSVSLYLPHYDEKGLTQVIERLSRPDPQFMPPTEITRGSNRVELIRRSGSEDAFAALHEVPSYVVPTRPTSNQVRRLGRLGRLLAHDNIIPKAIEQSRSLLLDRVRQHHQRIEDSEGFATIVKDKGVLNIAAHEWLYGAGVTAVENQTLRISKENVDDLFSYAGRKLTEGLHKYYWRSRVEDDEVDPRTAKLETFALVLEDELLDDLQTVAKEQVKEWLERHQSDINSLPDVRRHQYDEVRELGGEPEATDLQFPYRIEWSTEGERWPKHLYVGEDDTFWEDLGGWESATMNAELERGDIVGWLRNPPRKPWSLCVPYKDDTGRWRGLYPDLIVVRKQKGSVVVDVLEPHSPSLADAPAKARGLAEYADKHRHRLGRIQIIMRHGGDLKRLELTDEDTRNKVKTVTNRSHLEQLLS